jgi:hypothetical protein
MKTKLSLLILVSCFFCLLSLNAQIPQGFNYQAIVRNSSGDVIQNQNVKVKVAIQKFDGTVLWDEEHSLTTTQFGLVTFVVGTGPNLTGSVTDFSTIDWTAQTLYLKTYVQYPVPGSYTPMGTTQIWSVPYALRSKESEQWKTSGSNIYRPSGNVGIGVSNPLSKVVVQPDASWDDGTPLFEVKNKIGVPVLAVYNNGVRILVDHTYTKGLKGGFAVGGYDQTKAGKTVDFMTISPDSIRFNINNDNAKGLKGGFAVGGFDVTNKGGPINQDFMYITPQTSNNGQYNTFLGYQAGFNNGSSGLYNSFIGYNAGHGNTAGGYNVFIGHQAGSNSTNTNYNTAIGYMAGQNTATNGDPIRDGMANVFIGQQAGQNVTTGCRSVLIGMIAGLNWTGGGLSDQSNVFIGYDAGAGTAAGATIGSVTGNFNTYIGTEAAKRMLTGDLNVYIGHAAAVENKYGSRNVMIGGQVNYAAAGGRGSTLNDNVYIGYLAAGDNKTGINNVMIGSSAGGNNHGSNNLFIGYQAGADESGSSKLYIDNSRTATPLIYGDFTDSSEKLQLNGNVGIKIAPTHLIDLSGGAYSNGATWTNSSDKNLKENFEVVNGEQILGLIESLPITEWNYKVDNPSIKHIGPVSQDFYSLFGLGGNDTSISTVDPSGIALVAIKELSMQNRSMRVQIESQKIENQQLKSEMQALREEVEQIKSLQSKEGSK